MKRWKIVLAAVPMTMALAFPAFAGEWHQDMNGWWYETDDGSYYRNGWEWIDGDQDGWAECYYFNNQGYVAMRTSRDSDKKRYENSNRNTPFLIPV